MFTLPLDGVGLYRGALIHEVVGQRFRLLAEEVNVVALAHQAAAQVLDVDVAPGTGEHVAVGHDQAHKLGG